MNKWQPSSLKELWEESFSTEKFANNGFELLFAVPASLFFGCFYFLYRFPIAGIQLIIFFKYPTWLQGMGSFLAVIFSLLLHNIAIYLQSFHAIKSILRYLKFDLENKFTLEEHALEEYIGSDKVQEIRAARPVAWAKANQYPISRIFVRRAFQESTLSGQKKGFAAPVAYYNLGSPPQSISLIFIDEVPDELTESSKFFVYHEIGHTTKHAWRIKTKPYISVTMIAAIILWIFFNTDNYIMALILFLIYLLIRSFLELNPVRNSFEDEIIADTFAIRRLPEDFPLTKDDNRRKNLELILERSLMVSDKENSYLQVFNQKRLENAKKMIQIRKTDRPLTIFEIGQKAPVCDVFALGAVLVTITSQLHAPSIWFFLCVLTLTIVLFFYISFIYLARLIPGTNLVEDYLNQLTCKVDGFENSYSSNISGITTPMQRT